MIFKLHCACLCQIQNSWLNTGQGKFTLQSKRARRWQCSVASPSEETESVLITAQTINLLSIKDLSD